MNSSRYVSPITRQRSKEALRRNLDLLRLVLGRKRRLTLVARGDMCVVYGTKHEVKRQAVVMWQRNGWITQTEHGGLTAHYDVDHDAMKASDGVA